MTTWPDTTEALPPRDHHYATALWLLGRYPKLAALVDRIPGAVDTSDPGDPFLDLTALAEAVDGYDCHVRAMTVYRANHYEPSDDAAWEAWRAAGPQLTEGANAVAHMSQTERTRLRLLAFWSEGRVELGVNDLSGLDKEGQEFLADWCLALQAG